LFVLSQFVHTYITDLYHISISHTFTTYQYHIPISQIYITYQYHIPISQIYITYQYHILLPHINITYLYHRSISHINITYLYHISISHTYITHQCHISILHIEHSLQFFTAARTCHCSQQNILQDLPLLSAEHYTRLATVLSRKFYTTCHCSQHNFLHDLRLLYVLHDPPLYSLEYSTRPEHCATLGKFFVICITGMFIMKIEKQHSLILLFESYNKIQYNKENCSFQQRFQQKSPAARDHFTLRETISH